MRLVFTTNEKLLKDHIWVEIKNQNSDILLVMPDGSKHLILGIDEKVNMTNRQLVLLARKLIALSRKHRYKKLALDYKSVSFPDVQATEEEKAEIIATAFEMANYSHIRFKSEPKDGWDFVEEIAILGNMSQPVKDAFKRGQIIGHYVNASRELSNTPGSDMTPDILAQTTKHLAKGNKMKVTILDEKRIRAFGMGGLYSVGKGSEEKPRFIIMEYAGAAKKEAPIVLVGKAITFDTGGMNLKPAEGLLNMHMDMSGGSAVIQAVFLAEKLKLKKNIIALVPTAENMLSGSSFRPGDIVTTLSGKTIEIGNTDAEGRLIMADALTYATRFQPRLVVDVAALTGAAWVALGYRASAIFSKDDSLLEKCKIWGEKSGDYVWPMPLWDEYEDEIKGEFSDLHNTGKYQRLGGAITAAMLLYQFAKEYPWVHVDIAPRMVTYEGEYLSKGAYGTGVRLLIKILENY